MERVLSGVIVVDDNFYYVHMVEYITVRIDSIYDWVCCKISSGESGVESGDLGPDESNFIEECIVGTVSEVVHSNVQGNTIVRIGQESLTICRD